MLNEEFEACNTRDGSIVRTCPERRMAKVFTVDANVEKLRWQGDVSELPREWRELLRSAGDLYHRCLEDRTVDYDDGPSDGTATYLPGIGWCSTEGNHVQLLFEDGVRMEMNLGKQEILYCNANRRKEKWRLDRDRLPSYITERLDRCSAYKDVS